MATALGYYTTERDRPILVVTFTTINQWSYNDRPIDWLVTSAVEHTQHISIPRHSVLHSLMFFECNVYLNNLSRKTVDQL